VFKERVKGDHVTMTRNPDYWGPKPSFATQIYKAATDPAAREALIKAGQVDVVVSPPDNDVATLSSDSSLHVLKASGPWSTGVIINNVSKEQPLLQKVEVRQALNYAVDKQAIVKAYLFGDGVELDSPFSPSLPGYCSVGKWPYDPAKAKSMLQAAGASGMSVSLLNTPASQVITQIIANYLRAVGLKVSVPNPVDNATALTLTHVAPDKANYEMEVATLASGDMDPSRMMDDFSPEFPPANTLNFSFYNNQQVGDLIAKGNADSSNARYDTYCQAEKIIWNEAPWIWLYSAQNVLVTTDKVKNIYYLPNNYFVSAWAQPA
jgi:peptide/nickel transport system substrate-binding protein